MDGWMEEVVDKWVYLLMEYQWIDDHLEKWPMDLWLWLYG